jgi:hypothetical protein
VLWIATPRSLVARFQKVQQEYFTTIFAPNFDKILEAEYSPETLSNNYKVAGSILVEVTGFFNWSNLSSRTMALG